MTSEDFSVRVTAMTGTLYRVCCTVLSGEADREDAVQEAICKAWEKRDTLKNPRFFQTWLVRILLNTCYGVLRSRRRAVYMDELPELASETDVSVESMDLSRALSALDEEMRIPVVLYYAEGFSTEEIAEMLRISRNAVKMRLYRARAILKEKLMEEDANI